MTLPEAPRKYLCTDCGKTSSSTLIGENPFTKEEMFFCVHCHCVETLVFACQIEGCEHEACAGTPGAYGYRYLWTCSKHNPPLTVKGKTSDSA